jgi:hypothetical protein
VDGSILCGRQLVMHVVDEFFKCWMCLMHHDDDLE